MAAGLDEMASDWGLHLVFTPEPYEAIRIGNAICYECRAAAREAAAIEGRRVGWSEGRHWYYATIGKN